MSRRPTLLLLAAISTAGCGSIDKFLEGSQPPDARLRVSLSSQALTIIQGHEESFVATVTRIGDYSGAVSIEVGGPPDGVTAEVGGQTTVGAATTAPVTIRVASDVVLGTYILVVRGKADPIPVVATSSLTLTVLPPPGFALALSRSAFTIARGGTAPATVQISRTNFTAPVTLSLDGAPGISAVFGTNPAGGTSSTVTIAVDPAVAPGSHNVTLRGTGEGLDDRSLPFTVTVTDDPLQLITEEGTATPQGSVVTVGITINRPGYAGAVALSAENLPAGVTASFEPAAPAGTTATMTLFVQPSVVPETYPITVKGAGSGIPDATAGFFLTVNRSGLVLSLAPVHVSLFQGTNSPATLTLTRTALTALVALSVEGVPAGVTVALSPVNVAGGTSAVTVTAAAFTAPGDYTVTIRATPAGWPPGASETTPLGITVREQPVAGGNVVLDWTGCAEPDWVAVRDGNGPWTRVVPQEGVVGFSVNSEKGGFAYVESGNTVTVRLLTRAELTAQPIGMCPAMPVQGNKTITGQGVHNNVSTEQFSYSLGGGTATSTGASPNFTLTGVGNGTHDLVAWGRTVTIFGLRGLLRRDLDIPDGGSLGTVDLLGPGSFAPVQPTLFVGFVTGEQVQHSMSYLTTSACTANPLYSAVPGSGVQMAGVPEALQRPDDFHRLTVAATLAGRTRVVTQTFRVLSTRTVALPPLVFQSVGTVSGSYKRLEAFIATIPGSYNQSVTLRYSAGTKTMTVSASIGYAGTSEVLVTMPDFSGVSGWSDGYAVPSSAGGIWNVSLEGNNSIVPVCSEGRTTMLLNQLGGF